MSQVSGYGLTLDRAQAGQKYDIRPDVVGSYAAEEIIPFGVAVTYGTDPEKECTILDHANDKFLGVSLFTHTVENPAYNGTTPADASFAIGQTVPVLRKGAVWVEVTETVVAGDTAYAEVSTDQGLFSKTSTGNVATGGKFLTGGDAGDLVVLELL